MKCGNQYLSSLLLFACLLTAWGQGDLREQDIIDSLKETYPPYLASLIEQDLANARVRQAIGAFDTNLSLKAENGTRNYYDGSNYEFLLERPFEQIGGSLYGGYRLSNGFLPSYKRDVRTGSGGEAVLGVKIPFLRDFLFNPRKANLSKAEIERELVKPTITLQFIDMMKTARLAYYDWLIQGYTLMNTRALLKVAEERQGAFEKEVEQGARPEIILIDNQRLVIERTIAYNNAKTDFENTTYTLSLFYRDMGDQKPIMVSFERMPSELLLYPVITDAQRAQDTKSALAYHPQLQRLDLLQKRTQIELNLAKNNQKPDLSLALELNQSVNGESPEDIEDTELTSLLKFTIPLGRNEAKGLEEEALSKLEQLSKQRSYAKEVITTDISMMHNSLNNSYETYSLAQTHESLAKKLLEAEGKMFSHGASDLLQLQLREQTYLQAQLMTLKNLHLFYKSYAHYIAVSARDAKYHYTPFQN